MMMSNNTVPDDVISATEAIAALILAQHCEPRENEFTVADVCVQLDDSCIRRRLRDAGFEERRVCSRVFYSKPGLGRVEAIEEARRVMPKPLDKSRETCISLIARRLGVSKDVAARHIRQLVAEGKLRACGERILDGALVKAYEVVV